MQKELLISAFIVIAIIIGNVIEQNNTKQTVEMLNSNLEEVRSSMLEVPKETTKIKEKMESTQKKWKESYEKMAYYIEHDELEKVESELTKLNANITTGEYETGVECLDNCKFILAHIKEKTSLKIVNVF